MTFKLVGALLVFIGCSSIGFSIALQSKREEIMLRQISQLIEYMSCELQYRQTALPELFYNASSSVSGELKYLCLSVSKELESQNYPDASSCFLSVLTDHYRLSTNTIAVLERFAASLGIFDLSGQLNVLNSARLLCEKKLNHLEQNHDERMRSCRTLGICAGAALAILLF